MTDEKKLEKKNFVKTIAECAVMIALATVLSLFEIRFLPQGGGITIMGMLPIILIAYRHGAKWGFGSAFVFSLIQILLGITTVVSFFVPGDDNYIGLKAIFVVFLDYIVAYTALGTAAIFRKIKNPTAALCLGTVVSLMFRFLAHFISGAIFFSMWGEWFFGECGDFGVWVMKNITNPAGFAMFYSLIYNATFMVPEIIITTTGAAAISTIPFFTKRSDDPKPKPENPGPENPGPENME